MEQQGPETEDKEESDSDKELYRDSESSEDERGWVREVKRQHKMARQQRLEDAGADVERAPEPRRVQPVRAQTAQPAAYRCVPLFN